MCDALTQGTLSEVFYVIGQSGTTKWRNKRFCALFYLSNPYIASCC